MRAKRDLPIIYDERGAIGNWVKEWLRKPPWVKCPKCGEYGRLYVLRVKRKRVISLQPFVHHGSKRHFIKRLLMAFDDRVWDMMAKLSEFEFDKLMGYLRARRFGVPVVPVTAIGSWTIYKPKLCSKIIDDLEPYRELEYAEPKTLHSLALNRLKEILKFHHWTVKEDRGVLYAMPLNFMDYALKFYVKVGSKPIVRLNYDFERSALAVLKLKKRVKNGRVWYEGRWLYTPLYELEHRKGSSVRLSKLPLYPLYELIENIRGMGGSNVMGF
jgi:hypothetical protein